MLILFQQVASLSFKRQTTIGNIDERRLISNELIYTYLMNRLSASNQAQNLQQAPMPMSPQPGQTGRGASVVSF
jgi:hypothetical protein